VYIFIRFSRALQARYVWATVLEQIFPDPTFRRQVQLLMDKFNCASLTILAKKTKEYIKETKKFCEWLKCATLRGVWRKLDF
jgi:hypothetical protein